MSLACFLLQLGPILNLFPFKSSWLPPSVTSWSISHLTKESCQPGWSGPCSGLAALLPADALSKNETSCHGGAKEAAPAAYWKECLQPDFRRRIRQSVQESVQQPPEYLGEIITDSPWTRLNQLEEHLETSLYMESVPVSPLYASNNLRLFSIRRLTGLLNGAQ